MKHIITNRIYASSMGGIKILTGDWYKCYFSYNVIVTGDEVLWEEHSVDNFILYANKNMMLLNTMITEFFKKFNSQILCF
ncbi:hypothetical protein SD457_11000 [Coprobacillaceae bacterium CR2/5/TPMF4]|nr:hypothetical protein SD457_11000 [Coprobacillaceae bacterium CR2/5/TPMF4]